MKWRISSRAFREHLMLAASQIKLMGGGGGQGRRLQASLPL